ncbi:MAG: aminopeptidase [Bacteroidales bacterium]|jgi:bleomycin hydrolase|nr:aminopeptidase [Bacteroidales bacterium]
MKTKQKKLFAFTSILLLTISLLSAQESYQFEDVYNIKTTSVKNQQKAGTCWSYATTSFIETELIRKGYHKIDLSEIYTARFAYEQKAIDYVRYHGKTNFSQGGQAHDVMNEIVEHGMVPESVYDGKNYGTKYHIHSEIEAILSSIVETVVKNKNSELTPVWFDAYCAVLDVYFGKEVQKFNYKDKDYTPQSFVKSFNFDVNDYIEFTSYTHHPFYKKVILEIPDNWSNDSYFNIPLNELVELMNNALKNGYSVDWDGDVSDKGFSHKSGVAVLPLEKDAEYKKHPVDEVNVDTKYRQQQFDNYNSTDDHLMHITGMVKDQNGTVYYKTKNSWAADSNDMGGYLNMSENYIKKNTIAIMINKDAIPKKLAKKLGIK